MSAAERYRKAAVEFTDLSKSASNQFIRGYYQRLAQRYLLHSDNQMKLAKIESTLATGRGREDNASIEPLQEAPGQPAAPPVRRRADGRRRSHRAIRGPRLS
jgi:hypothetical protein